MGVASHVRSRSVQSVSLQACLSTTHLDGRCLIRPYSTAAQYCSSNQWSLWCQETIIEKKSIFSKQYSIFKCFLRCRFNMRVQFCIENFLPYMADWDLEILQVCCSARTVGTPPLGELNTRGSPNIVILDLLNGISRLICTVLFCIFN